LIGPFVLPSSTRLPPFTRLFDSGFGQIPAHGFEINSFNLHRNHVPLITVENAAFGRFSCGLAHRRIRNQELQPLRQIRDVTSPKGETGVFDRLPILQDIGGEHAQSRTHRNQQRQ